MNKYWYLVAAGIFLLGALGSWPYVYYQLLRWVVCGAAAYTVYLGLETEHKGIGWLMMVIIAILFNPIAPIYFPKGTWFVLDLVAAVVFFAYAYFLKDHHD
jgi:asparagine N-glycosylation enzyme membrane subunit Stt3